MDKRTDQMDGHKAYGADLDVMAVMTVGEVMAVDVMGVDGARSRRLPHRHRHSSVMASAAID
jgi:hypothetical protein